MKMTANGCSAQPAALLKPDEHERMKTALISLRESGHVVTARTVADAGASCV